MENEFVGIKTNKLLGLRKSVGIKQDEIAKFLEINQATFSKKERGVSEFKRTEMEKVTIYLRRYFPDITMEEIFFS